MTITATKCQMLYCNKTLVFCETCGGMGDRGREMAVLDCVSCTGTGLKCPEHDKQWQYRQFSDRIVRIGMRLYQAYCRESTQPDKLWQWKYMPPAEKQAWLVAVEKTFGETLQAVDEAKRVVSSIYL